MGNDRWMSMLRKAATVGGEVASVAVHLSNGITPVGAMSAGVKFLDSVLKLAPTRGPVDGWAYLNTVSRIEQQVFNLLKCSDALRVTWADDKADGAKCFEWSTPSGDARWVVSTSGHIDGPFVRPGDEEGVTDALRDLVWSSANNRAVMRVESRDWRDFFTIEEDHVGHAEPSSTADDLWARINAVHAAGEHVAVLLHGPPGTGKSCIARRLATLAGGRVLRLTAQHLWKSGTGTLLDFLRPDLVVVDDLDRGASSFMLEQIDELRARTSLLVATVNNSEALDPALLRVGRFDELVEVLKLDDAVLDALLADVPSADAARIRDLPIAYIERYLKLRTHLGQELATAEVARLVERHELVTAASAKDADAPVDTKAKGKKKNA